MPSAAGSCRVICPALLAARFVPYAYPTKALSFERSSQIAPPLIPAHIFRQLDENTTAALQVIAGNLEGGIRFHFLAGKDRVFPGVGDFSNKTRIW